MTTGSANISATKSRSLSMSSRSASRALVGTGARRSLTRLDAGIAEHRRVGLEVAAGLAPERPNRNAPPSLDLEASPHGRFRAPLDPGRLEVRAARDVEH